MTKLVLEEFLKTHDNWEKILTSSPYNITIKRDNGYVLFKYNQYYSDMSERICQEARGIIFYEPTLTPVCVPFFKFFNYGEENAAEIDWDTKVVTTEKIDGSLIKLWYHNDEWHLSTNNTIDAYKAIVGDSNVSFGVLFEISLGVSMQELLKYVNPNYTYMFELVHSLNELVIRYGVDKVYLLAMRNMMTYDETDFPLYLPGVHFPKEYNLNNMSNVLSLVEQMNESHEGVVIRDAHFNRVKVKSPLYLMRAKAWNNGVITDRRIIQMYRQDILDDFLSCVPRKTEQVTEVIETLRHYMERQNVIYGQINSIRDRKAFIEAAKRLNGDINYMIARYEDKFQNPMDYVRSYLFIPAVIRILQNERNIIMLDGK